MDCTRHSTGREIRSGKLTLMVTIRWIRVGKPALVLLTLLSALLLNGCCVGLRTSVRNGTGCNLTLMRIANSNVVETVPLPISKAVLCGGVWPTSSGDPSEVWIISDGKSQFTYTNASLIAKMPSEFASSSRLNSDWPCLRVTRHVAITPDMAIHAERVIGYTKREPEGFPIWYSERKE